MKKWLIHILSAAMCCMALTACTAEEGITNTSVKGEGKVAVSFLLDIPSARNSTDNTDINYNWERYINEEDIHVLVFIGNKFQEEVKRLFIENEDGNITRRVTGTLANAYEGQQIQLVVLTNTKSRGITVPNLQAGYTTMEKLYNQLIFDYNEAWTFSAVEKNYIPMWGISDAFFIQPDILNEAGQINMYRAIAKIDIIVNNGNGLGEDKGNFMINSMELCNVPTQGRCVSSKKLGNDQQFEAASLPENIQVNTNPFPVYTRPDGEAGPTTRIENRIYIPEVEVYKPYPYFCIRIKASIYGKEKEFSLYMRDNQTDIKTGFDIIRNHKYILNIRSITSSDEIKLGYSVNSWGKQTEVDFSPFE